MTRDDIIERALQCGIWIPLASGLEREQTIDKLHRFAALVAAAERTGVHHHALSDAEAQAAHLLRMLDSDLTPAHRSCNACDWSGPVSECVMLGSVGPLCPDCRETTDTVDTAGDAKQ